MKSIATGFPGRPGVLLLASVFALTILQSCKEGTAEAKKEEKVEVAPDLTLSEKGLGDLKIGMEIAEVEKVIGQKLELLNKNPEVLADSAKTNYKGAPVSLYFDHVNELSGIKTTESKFRTASGVGVGSDKNEIWNAYNDGYSFNMYPDYEDSTYTTRSKTRYFISISNMNGLADGDNIPLILFTMINGKATEVEATRIYNDSE